MNDALRKHTDQMAVRYMSAMADANPGHVALYRDYANAFTRIGNALGLEGQFLLHFGYQQIEQKAKDAIACIESLSAEEP